MIHTTSPTQLAVQYAIDTPTATADELQAMFAIRPCDATYAHRRGVESRRTDLPLKPTGKGNRPMNNAAALAAAREWALKNSNSEKVIYDNFNITSAQSRRISKEATAAKGGRKCNVENRAKALEYLKANIHTPAREIGRKFHVSADWICQQRRRIQVGEKAVATTPVVNRSRVDQLRPRRKHRRLYAVLDDGSLVNPKTCKNIASAAKFVEVLV